MKLYIAIFGGAWNDSDVWDEDIIGVFSSKEKAIQSVYGYLEDRHDVVDIPEIEERYLCEYAWLVESVEYDLAGVKFIPCELDRAIWEE